MLCVDIDRFRVINTCLGRAIGDRLLNEIAARLVMQLGHHDSIGKIGGDEFAILIEEKPDRPSAVEIANSIQSELIGGFVIDGAVLYATASIGVARLASSYVDAEEVLRDAEIAMYCAKSNGRARVEVFQGSMLLSAHGLFQLETDLRRAVERQEFELHFQPIVSVKTGKVRAFESLLRWRHPSKGLQLPGSFLPLLKETGLILSLGSWIIEEACRHAKKWQDIRGRPVPVTINIAPQQFSQSVVVSQVTEALERTGAHPGSVVLEITEDVLIEDLDVARATLLPLRYQGIRTMIDDFGTGYSSLSYLRRLPIDAIKVDSSFVDRIEGFAEDRLIVRAIVALAHALELCVVAEGVERREQLRELVGLDCEEAQGYLVSPPVSGSVAADMVASRWAADAVISPVLNS